ncbi:hypothetical protein V5799_033189 [Amblyomma americanum]|uniref:Calcineurin-like phosphoesterase domain-containing protein n=1 Tax=Amblyomma americanum TaxID=6943 RepID=A0AAQ4DP10_AMBAM
MVPHDVWNTSRAGNLAVTKYTADAIAKFLPGVPVFPAVGNHEGHPANWFKATVRGEFFGHSHADELKVAYDSRYKKLAFGVAYLAPSLTTYGSGHPAFRIFTVDGGYSGASWVRLTPLQR